MVEAIKDAMNRINRINRWDAYWPMSIHKAMWRKMLKKGLPEAPVFEDNIPGDNTGLNAEGIDTGGSGAEIAASEAAKTDTSAAVTDNALKAGDKKDLHTDEAEKDDTYRQSDENYMLNQNDNLIFEDIRGLEESAQIITVTPVKTSKSWAKLRLYEKVDGNYRKVYHDMKAYIGLNGFKPVKNAELTATERMKYKCEGDNATPAGIYTISSLFGWGENAGFAMPYRQTKRDDYWVSSAKKEEYNVLATRKGGPSKSWTVYEKLDLPEYKYAAVIDYNNGPDRIVNNGSAIFLHISGDRDYTSGCVSLSEGNLLKVLKWLKPESKPVIVLGRT